MIKILHLISTLDRGGAEISLNKLISNMDKYRFQNVVVSLKNVGPVGKQIQENDFSVFPLNMKKGFPDPKGVLPFYNILQKIKPDIIQCWLYHANLFGLLFKNKAKVLWNIRCSNIKPLNYGIVYYLTVKLGAALSGIPKVVILNSKSGLMVHNELGFHPKRWKVINNGFDTQLFRPDYDARTEIRSTLGIPFEATVIGRVARFDPVKDYESFFKAVNLVLKNKPQVHFIVIGEGMNDKNVKLMKLLDNDVKENVHLLGDRDNMHKVYAAIDIHTSNSISEGFPNNVGEAMAVGVPCVVTDVGDSALIVSDTGAVIKEKDPMLLAKTWTSLIEDKKSTLKDMGRRARERIQKHYSIQAMVENYELIYRELIQGVDPCK